MPVSLTPSEAAVLGLIAKKTTDALPARTSGRGSREELLGCLKTPAARELGQALIDADEGGPMDENSVVGKAVKFLRRWGGHAAA